MSNLNNKSSVSMKKATWRIFKKNGVVVNSMAAATIALMATSSFADPLPTGGTYVSGTGTIGSSGNTMNINQSTTNGIINWGSFSIGVGNTVNINNGDGATMNRVIGSDPSAIYGQLNATGSAYLINQNGIVIGPSGQVNTGGNFVASTRDISDDDFNDGGTNTFEGTSNAGVVNQGYVTAGGHAIIIGQTVNNSGSIYSSNGDALIGAGNKVLLTETNPVGERMFVEVAGGSITNSGNIEGINAELKANGGNIYALAINNSGTVRARAIQGGSGRVVLKADNDITNSGYIQAGQKAFVTGAYNPEIDYNARQGIVDITGRNINLENNSSIDTGGGGRLTMNAANGNWRSGTGSVNYNGTVTLASDSMIINSGKTATGARTDMKQNVKLVSSGGSFGTINLNGFDTVNLNVVTTPRYDYPMNIPVVNVQLEGEEDVINPQFDGIVENDKLVTTGSLIINAKNITIDEDMQVGGDFVLNAAAFDDNTNNFVPQAGKGPNTLFSDGWKTNHGSLIFAGTSRRVSPTGYTTAFPTDLSICCGVTLTSGLDENGNRSDLTSDKVRFSYNNDTNTYKWFEAKGFGLFETEFEGGELAVFDHNNPTNNGFIILNNDYNLVNFDAFAANNIDIIANYDTVIGDVDPETGEMLESGVDIVAGGDLTIVVDEANPFTDGDGGLGVSAGSNLVGTNVGIYTSRQANNEILGTINREIFTPGTEFTDSALEKWLVFFSSRGTDGNKSPFKVYYKNQATVTGRPDCGSNPNQSGCENFASFSEQNKEYRVALAQDSTAPEEGALAWGNSSQVRANEFYTIKAYDYVDTNLTTSEKLTTFWYALPIQLVNIPLDGVAQVPGIQAIAEGIKGLTNGVESGLNSVVR